MEATDRFVYGATIVSWYDADTCRVDIDLGLGVWLRNQSVRLFGINAPELRPKTAGRSMEDIDNEKLAALKALELAQELAPAGSKVLVRTYKDKTEKYGRWLADIQCYGAARTVNQALLDAGLVKTATY